MDVASWCCGLEADSTARDSVGRASSEGGRLFSVETTRRHVLQFTVGTENLLYSTYEYHARTLGSEGYKKIHMNVTKDPFGRGFRRLVSWFIPEQQLPSTVRPCYQQVITKN